MNTQLAEQYVYPKFRKYIVLWMRIFTPIALSNAVLLYFFNAPEYPTYENISILLPFANCGAMCGVFMIYGVYWWSNYDNYIETQYLKEKYPEIWKKLHPWGDWSVNGFAGLFFIFGRYDDGSDDKLNQIKLNQKANAKLLCWIFFLVPVSWVLNLCGLLLSDMAEKI